MRFAAQDIVYCVENIMSVLFCDTDCELWYTTARELGVKVIPMPYTVDGEERFYDLGENTDLNAFFKRMREGASVSTAASGIWIGDKIRSVSMPQSLLNTS